MANSISTPSLSFPPQTFAALSPSAFLLAHLKPDSSKTPALRPNQRAPHASRPPHINTSSLTHANGSAVVRLENTAVVCSVRGEILKAEDIPQPYNDPIRSPEQADQDVVDDNTAQTLGLLVPNIELSTGCSPQHIPGNAPSTIAQSLAHRLRSLLHSSHLVRSSDLRIWSGPAASASTADVMQEREEEEEKEDTIPRVKAYWTLYIDILFITLDGGAFDAAWGAIVAALRDTKLPGAWWDADREMVLCSDRADEAKGLSLRGLPIGVGFGIFTPSKGGRKGRIGGKSRVLKGWAEREAADEQEAQLEAWAVADTDAFEERLCDEQITVVLDCSNGKTKLLKIEKNGGIVVGMKEMKQIIRLAEVRWAEWQKCLDERKR
ncbi:MAG: hypothetical protein M1822_001752 [Bathelium mastoideum]|nr:MAG: hypothetical protein M1822_001752 [Bathelium mastoideum]